MVCVLSVQCPTYNFLKVQKSFLKKLLCKMKQNGVTAIQQNSSYVTYTKLLLLRDVVSVS